MNQMCRREVLDFYGCIFLNFTRHIWHSVAMDQVPQRKMKKSKCLLTLYSKLKTMSRAVYMVLKSSRKFVLMEIKDYSNVEFLDLCLRVIM